MTGATDHRHWAKTRFTACQGQKRQRRAGQDKRIVVHPPVVLMSLLMPRVRMEIDTGHESTLGMRGEQRCVGEGTGLVHDIGHGEALTGLIHIPVQSESFQPPAQDHDV